MDALHFRHFSQGPGGFFGANTQIHFTHKNGTRIVNLIGFLIVHLKEAEEEGVNGHVVNPKE